jgi:hypothetical protein
MLTRLTHDETLAKLDALRRVQESPYSSIPPRAINILDASLTVEAENDLNILPCENVNNDGVFQLPSSS